MKYGKYINEFKASMKEQYRLNDCSKPKKNTKHVEIIVQEHENNRGSVALNYSEEFYRMFGRHNTTWTFVYQGDLKTACEIARELKAEAKLPIKFWKYEKLEMF